MPVFIDGYEVDVAISENHQYDSDITSDPVEVGSDITDHQRLLPDMVTMTGLVSDTPFGDLADRRLSEGVPSVFALGFFRTLRDARVPVTIETSLRVYDNMLMKTLTVPRNARTGNALAFTAVFKQVVLVTNERTTIRVKLPRAKKTKSLGAQQINEVPPAPATVETAKKNKSILAKIASAL